ncbi:MAG: hypothetical protein AAF335_03890 [Bacteroidota bacterium]
MKVYVVSHFHDISYEQEEYKIIGYFSSKKRAEEVAKAYKKLPGFKDVPPEVEWTEIGQLPSWEGGFLDGLEWLKELHKTDGLPLTIIEKDENEDEEDLILEIPYWARDASLKPSESSEAFAHRLMRTQGIKEYPTAPESEFYQIKRWADNLKKYSL